MLCYFSLKVKNKYDIIYMWIFAKGINMNNINIKIENIQDFVSELEKRLKINVQSLQNQINEIKTIIDNLSTQINSLNVNNNS